MIKYVKINHECQKINKIRYNKIQNNSDIISLNKYMNKKTINTVG